jgi:hypothetical protein
MQCDGDSWSWSKRSKFCTFPITSDTSHCHWQEPIQNLKFTLADHVKFHDVEDHKLTRRKFMPLHGFASFMKNLSLSGAMTIGQ